MLNIGLLGAGYIAPHHAKALRKIHGLHIAAFCDKDMSKANQLCQTFGGGAVYSDVDEMLAREKLDCIHVLLPPDSHAKAAEKILMADINVFLEKPMAVNTEECRRLTALATERNLKLGVNHNFLFYRPYEKLKKLIQDHAFGPIDHLTLTWQKPLEQIQYGPFGIWMLREPHFPLLEVGPHLITCAIDLLGTPEIIWSEPSNPATLPDGRQIFRRWIAIGRIGKTCIELRIALNQGFEEHSISVRGLGGYGAVDFERNLFSMRRHTSSSRPFDLEHMCRSEAFQIGGQGETNLFRYIFSKLKMFSFGDPYAESLGASIRNFYSNYNNPIDQRLTPSLALQAVQTAEKIAENQTKKTTPAFHVRRKQPARTLVLGGTGFIGKALVKDLIESNTTVRLIARDPEKLGIDDPLIDVIKGDLTDQHTLQQAFDGIEIVYHLARAHANSWQEYLNGFETTRSIAEACLKAKVNRLVYTGTIDTYYGGTPGETITEQTPIDPRIQHRNLYARAKAKEENLLRQLHSERKLPLVIVRPGIVLGSGSNPCHWGVGMWYYQTICHFWGEGKNPLPFVLVSDTARGIHLAGEVKGIEGESFNLIDIPCLNAREYVDELSKAAKIKIRTSPRPIWRYFLNETGKWIVKSIVRHPGRRIPSYHDWASRTQMATYDFTKARKILGWQPSGNLQELIKQGIHIPAHEWVS